MNEAACASWDAGQPVSEASARHSTSTHSRTLQQSANFQEPKTPTFAVFSALHDAIAGEVHVQAQDCSH